MTLSLPRPLLVLPVLAALLPCTFVAGPASAAVLTSTGVRCTIVGTAGADVLVGTGRRDVICGRGGNDVIRGRGGDDLVDAGPGSDRIVGGDGNDTLLGGSGNDIVAGEAGNDVVRAETGSDRVTGGLGADRITGGDGDDSLYGSDGQDAIAGQDGRDTISGGASGDKLTGGLGDDELTSGTGTDSVDGGGGDNLCIVDAADETIRCRYDEEPPVVVAATVSPGAVDVTAADAQVTVRVHVTDDIGVGRLQAYLAQHYNGAAFWIPNFDLVSGTIRDGWWRATVTVPRGTLPDTFWLDLSINDRLGRSTNSDGGGLTVQVADTDPDLESPQLTLSSVTPGAVDVRTQARNVTVTVHGVDARSGLSRLDICLGRPGIPTETNPYPLFRSVDCTEDVTRASGTAQNGTWTTTLTIPKGSVGATYNVFASVEDRVTNRAHWFGPEAYQQWDHGNWCCGAAYAFPDDAGRVEVTGTVADTTPAWISAVTASKTELRTLASPDKVTVRVRAQDATGAGEGVTKVTAMLVSSQSLGSDPQFTQTTLELASGTVTDGWWQGDVVAPQGTPPGTYHLLAFVVDRSHGTGYTDPTGPFANGITYQALEGIPTLTVVDERP